VTTRVVPFSERRRGVSLQPSAESTEPVDPAAALVQPDGTPARRSKKAKCPQCGAGANRRLTSLGAASSTCGACGFEFQE